MGFELIMAFDLTYCSSFDQIKSPEVRGYFQYYFKVIEQPRNSL